MASIKLDLPTYVVARGPRKNGTYRVIFQVPARLRPDGWPAERPLPFSGPRTGDLRDPAQVALICADAEILYSELKALRLGRSPVVRPYTLPAVARIWQDPTGDYWPELAPRTQRFYSKVLMAHVLPWSLSNGHPDIRKMERKSVIAFLRLFQKQPHVRKHVRATLSQLLTVAQDIGWIDENPAKGIRLKGAKKTAVDLWSAADVEQHVDAALAAGWVGGARLILGIWETCARATDAMIWRRGEHYDPHTGRFSYETNKTNEEVANLPISQRLKELFDNPRTLHLVLDPSGNPYESVRDDNRMGKDFRRLNDKVVAAGGRRLILRQLRHSAINHALDCGATIEGVKSATAHASDRTLQIYVRRSEKRAVQVQKLRGIV